MNVCGRSASHATFLRTDVGRSGVKLEGVAVAGVGMVRFGRYPDRSGADLARDAGLAALHDAGITLADVDEAFVGYVEPKSMLGVKAMKELGLTGLPGHPHRERLGHRAGGVPRGGVGGGLGPRRGGHGHRLRQDDRDGQPGRRAAAPAATSSTPRSFPPPTSRCGRSAACTTTAPPARPSPPSPPRTGTTAPSARGATASPTTPSRSRRCWRRRWCPSRSPR